MSETDAVKKQTAAKDFTEPCAILLSPAGTEGQGELRIHENALATIIKRAVLSVKGVSRFSGSTFLNDLAEMVRSRKIQDRSIVIRINGQTLEIDISIYTYFGVNLRNIAAEIKKNISRDIGSMTGLQVTSVSVKIRGMDDEPAEEPEENKEPEEKDL